MTSTRTLRVDPAAFDPAALDSAVESLRSGGLVGLPTETTYGVAVNLENPGAVLRARAILGVPGDAPFTIYLGDRDDLRKVVPGPIPAPAQRLIQRFWPGPLTLIFSENGGEDVAVRYPNHPVARSILKRAGVRTGLAPATEPGAVTGDEARSAFEGKVDVLVDAGPARHHGPATVVRVGAERAELVREGAIPRTVIDEVNVTTLLFVCTGNTCRSPMAEALGRKLLADRLGVPQGDLESRGYKMVSAGTGAGHGTPASEEAEQAVKRYGADLSRHASRPVTVALVEEADRVWVMTPRHRQVLVEWMPEHAKKIELLDPKGDEVPDPIGGPAAVYREAAQQIHDSLRERLKELP